MQALAQLGWTNGRNLQMEIRWGGGGDVNRARNFAKELVALQPDVILAQGTPVTAALHRETRTIPIVFVVVTDPVGDGFVAGLPRPGGNITGFLTSEAGITAKMLELLREIAPGLRRVAILFNPDTAPGGGKYYFGEFEAAARSSNVEPIAARARSDAEIETVVTSLKEEPRGGVVVMPDFFMFNHVKPIISLAGRCCAIAFVDTSSSRITIMVFIFPLSLGLCHLAVVFPPKLIEAVIERYVEFPRSLGRFADQFHHHQVNRMFGPDKHLCKLGAKLFSAFLFCGEKSHFLGAWLRHARFSFSMPGIRRGLRAARTIRRSYAAPDNDCQPSAFQCRPDDNGSERSARRTKGYKRTKGLCVVVQR